MMCLYSHSFCEADPVLSYRKMRIISNQIFYYYIYWQTSVSFFKCKNHMFIYFHSTSSNWANIIGLPVCCIESYSSGIMNIRRRQIFQTWSIQIHETQKFVSIVSVEKKTVCWINSNTIRCTGCLWKQLLALNNTNIFWNWWKITIQCVN